MSRQITLEEVKKHASERNGVWTIIHHEVYDVTKFLDEHPGGADVLLEYGGKDSTQPFEDVAHSEDAREMMKKYKIGDIDPSDRINPPSPSRLKWAVIALAGALVIGIVLKKYMAT